MIWLAQLPNLEGSGRATMPTWPTQRRDVWMLATLFLLREVEVASLVFPCQEIEFDEAAKTVTIRLAVSKTDPEGRGCRRTLACNCQGCEINACPYCSAMALVIKQEKCTGVSRFDQEAASIPVGQADDPRSFVKKECMIAALREDVRFLQASWVVNRDVDISTVSGHSLRRSGCKHYARMGLPIDMIQHMSRHSSSAVMGYVEEAMEETPTASTRMLQHMMLQDQVAQIAFKTASLEKMVQEATDRVKTISLKAGEGNADRNSISCIVKSFVQPEVIVNLATLKIHSTYGCIFSSVPLQWKTACGWQRWHWVSAGRLVKSIMSSEERPCGATVCDKCADRLPEWCF